MFWANGRKFDRWMWRGRIFSVRRVQGYSMTFTHPTQEADK